MVEAAVGLYTRSKQILRNVDLCSLQEVSSFDIIFVSILKIKFCVTDAVRSGRLIITRPYSVCVWSISRAGHGLH
jgi:hypothetical protein